MVLVIALTYATSFILVPYLDKQLPIIPIILIVYVLVAYIGLPFVVRIWRIVFRPNHIPRYVTTPDGWPSDPVNIAVIVRDRRHLIKTMEQAGWHVADKSSLKNLLHEAYAIVFDKPYLTAPFSALYLFGRKFDIGFQIPYGANKSPRNRHHVRFWKLTDTSDIIDTNNHFEYWLLRFKTLFRRRNSIWIGAAVDDLHPIGFRLRNLQLTHASSGQHHKERDYIISTLQAAGVVKKITTIKDGEPFTMRAQHIGTSFVVDGFITVVTLKRLPSLIPKP